MKRKTALILLILSSAIFFALLGHISTACIFITERLIEFPMLNHVVAGALVIGGFSFCGLQLICYPLNISSGVKAYFSSAVAMGGVYYTINICKSQCFSFASQNSDNASVLDFVYFSFVTVTTVGFGDITPQHTFIRLLVVLQILFGLMITLKIATKQNKFFTRIKYE